MCVSWWVPYSVPDPGGTFGQRETLVCARRQWSGLSLDDGAAVCSLVDTMQQERVVCGEKDGPRMVQVESDREEHTQLQRGTDTCPSGLRWLHPSMLFNFCQCVCMCVGWGGDGEMEGGRWEGVLALALPGLLGCKMR